jgi:serine/threonine protein kinase
LHNRESTKLDHFAFFHRFQSEVELAYKFRPDTGIFDGRLESGRALFNILALEQLGPNLDKILRHAKKTDFCKKNNHLNRRNKGLSFTTVVNIGEQLFSGLQYLHEKCIIHRDIKSQNICAGRGQRRQNIFIVDFGLSKAYKQGVKQQKIKFYLYT